MYRFILPLLILTAGCGDITLPDDPPAQAPLFDVGESSAFSKSPPPPPPPEPDYFYAPVPTPIARVLSDPDASIEIVVLGDGSTTGSVFAGHPVIRTERLSDATRDRVAAVLTSGVTYGYLGGLCSSPGMGFRLMSSTRSKVDVWVDPGQAKGEILGATQEEFHLSMAGFRLLTEIERELFAHKGCS